MRKTRYHNDHPDKIEEFIKISRENRVQFKAHTAGVEDRVSKTLDANAEVLEKLIGSRFHNGSIDADRKTADKILRGIVNRIAKTKLKGVPPSDSDPTNFFFGYETHSGNQGDFASILPTKLPKFDPPPPNFIAAYFGRLCPTEELSEALKSDPSFLADYIEVATYLAQNEIWQKRRLELDDTASGLKTIETQLNDSISEAEVVVQRAKDFSKFKELDAYFSEKANEHRRFFTHWQKVFFGSISVSMVIALLAVFGYGEKLPHVQLHDFQIGKALMFAAIVGSVLWTLKIMHKTSTLHLRLAEDASNRTVLIRTLAALESDQNIPLASPERIVAYNAIFRSSLPDSAQFDVTQPSIADLGGLMRKGG